MAEDEAVGAVVGRRSRATVCLACGGDEISGRTGKCVPCLKEYMRWYNIARKYGVSKEQYIRMLDEQQGRCAICGKMPGYDLRVDHDHATGKVRGLLCGACNVAIANLGDTVAGVEAALAYLRSTT